MLTVACVLSSLPFRNSVYDRSHVDRLAAMVDKYLKQQHRFVCVDDSPFPGYWAKVALFEKDRFRGRVLYLDLDTTAIDTLDDLVDHPYPFMICRDWLPTRRPDGTVFQSRFNSSVMVWDAGVADHIYEDFDYRVMQEFPGDQDWIESRMQNAKCFHADWCVSYKVQKLKMKSLPKSTKVVVYHGQPKSWDLPENELEGFARY